jgi:hypothetical protein
MKEYKKRLMLEEKKLKETELLINAERKDFKKIEHQLNQQTLKERLLRKIVEEKERKLNEEETIKPTEEEIRQQLELEILEKQIMEDETLQLIEEEKNKMQSIYEQLLLKNQEI